ncbi:MAG: O-antigen ligase family protein [Spirochaetes bacterium]|nr:O-antigen ligase family protein [Spirochaetota bacterium]
MINPNSKTKSYSVHLNSISIALLVSMNFIASMLRISGGIFIISLSIIAIQFYSRKGISISLKSILMILYILIIFLFSFLINDNNYYAIDSILKFFIFGIIPIYLSNCDFDEILVLKLILVIGFISLPFLTTRNYHDIASEYKMGLSYAILPIFFSAIILASEKYLYKIISWVVIIACVIILIDIGSRGAVVSLFCFISVFFFSKLIKREFLKYASLLLFTGLFFVLIENIWSVLSWLQFSLMKYDMSIYALDKTILYYGQDKLLNFRDYLWVSAIDGIKDSFLIGNGIGSFQLIHGTYVHNIFLQSIWEGGLLLFIPVVAVFFISLMTILHNSFSEKNIFLIYLLSLSFFSLLFSSMFWMNQNLWLLIGIVLNNYSKFPNSHTLKIGEI